MVDTSHFNVIEVISDQHIADCMGVAGHAQAITPNMDRLASQGMRFTQAYTQNPICTPSRTSILSGQYCHNHGYYGLGGPTPEKLPSFLGHFHEQGYTTAGIGKLHMPNRPTDWLLPHVDLWADAYSDSVPVGNKCISQSKGTSPYFRYLTRLGLRDKEDSIALQDLENGMQATEARPSELPFEHSVEGWCVQQACDFISGSGKTPFCMQVSLPRPHQCYTPDVRFWDMYPDDLDLPPTFGDDPSGRPVMFQNVVQFYQKFEGQYEPKDTLSLAKRIWKGYLACITHVDHALGLLMDHLEKTGLADRTILIYHADHGAYSTRYGLFEKAPGICSESVCRVPWIWRVPGITPAGQTCDQLVENIDIAETITHLCQIPAMPTTDGKDVTGLLKGENVPVRQMAVTEHPWSKSIRWKQWRLVHYQPDMFEGQDVGELYDLENDPLERHNLYHDADAEHLVHEGRQLLLQWLIGTSRPRTVLPSPNWPDIHYEPRTDGTLSNHVGVRACVERQALNYL